MISHKNVVTALALAVALAAGVAASPALAKSRAAHPGFEARAQATGETAADHMSGGRARAIHDCSVQASKFPEHSWGDRDIIEYRTCMAEHGQIE
jgi:hypothetical protein